MKSINKTGLMSLFVMIILVSSTSCHWDGDHFLCDKAKGDIVDTTINLSAFDRLELSIAADVYLTQDSVQSVRVVGEEDAIDNIELYVDNGKWVIGFHDCMRHEDLDFHISVPNLEQLAISASGDVYGQNTFITNDPIYLDISGSGEINMDIVATDIDADISGSGTMRLEGSCDELDANISGSGNINSFDLIATACKAKISGSGEMEVYVDGGVLDIDISGSGEVKYKGNPSSVLANVSGSGRVVDAN